MSADSSDTTSSVSAVLDRNQRNMALELEMILAQLDAYCGRTLLPADMLSQFGLAKRAVARARLILTHMIEARMRDTLNNHSRIK